MHFVSHPVIVGPRQIGIPSVQQRGKWIKIQNVLQEPNLAKLATRRKSNRLTVALHHLTTWQNKPPRALLEQTKATKTFVHQLWRQQVPCSTLLARTSTMRCAEPNLSRWSWRRLVVISGGLGMTSSVTRVHGSWMGRRRMYATISSWYRTRKITKLLVVNLS